MSQSSLSESLPLLELERARNAEGRPNLYEHVQRGAVERMLDDVHGLSKSISSNFKKWDSNSDGVVTPIELEDFVVNHANPQEERISAAAVRKAYDVLADMDAPFKFGVVKFLDASDVEGIELALNSDKRKEAADKIWQRDYEARMKPVENSNLFVRAYTDLMFRLEPNNQRNIFDSHATRQNYYLSNLSSIVDRKDTLFEFGDAKLCKSKSEYGCFPY